MYRCPILWSSHMPCHYKINVIIQKVIEDIGLIMQCSLKLKLIFYINHNFSLLDFYKNVKITMKKLKIKYSIFIIKHKNYNLVLGKLFSNLIKFS